MNRAAFFGLMKRIATLDKVGYLPAPGTCATVVTLPAVVLIKQIFSPQQELIFLLFCTIASLFVVEYALHLFPYPTRSSESTFRYDPPQIVIDEVIGCLWAFYGSSLSIPRLLLGFFVFRFFDISKPLGINRLQDLPRAWGIVADDLLAGFYTALILYVFA